MQCETMHSLLYYSVTLKAKFLRASKYLGYTTISNRDAQVFADLVKTIKEDPKALCSTDNSSPRMAWATFLDKFPVDAKVRKVILSACTIPMGTADV